MIKSVVRPPIEYNYNHLGNAKSQPQLMYWVAIRPTASLCLVLLGVHVRYFEMAFKVVASEAAALF